MLSFIDISGDFFSNTDQQRYITAGAVTIRKRMIAEITRTMHNLKRDILDNETLEIKSTSFLNRDTLNDPNKNKHRFIQSVFEQCIDSSDCYYSAVVIANENVKKRFLRERLSKHYIYLLQRIQNIAVRNRCQDVIILIDNDNRNIDKWAAYAFNNFLYRAANGHELDRILAVPIFADSEMTIGIQLADLVAGVLKRYYTEGLHMLPSYPEESLYIQKLIEYQSIIVKRCPNFGSLIGLYEAPANFLSLYYT